MRLGNLNLNGRVFSAPLAGVSNRPFRLLALSQEAAIVYTEMAAADGLVRGQSKTRQIISFQADERPIGVQLFGADPRVMGLAARIVASEFAPDLIDINFGCPVKKVVRKNGGAAVLKDLALTADIVAAVVEGAGQVPVTIKIRTGWDDERPVYIEAGLVAQKAGAVAVTLHARSRSSGFAGEADWTAIKRLKEAVSIAVIGNGDVVTPHDAGRMIDQTNCDAVMVGRAGLGNPFVYAAIHHFLEDGVLRPEPTLAERIRLARRHACLLTEQYGQFRGVRMMRKHLAWYVRGLPGAATLRARLFQVESLADIDQTFESYLAELAAAP